MKQTDNKNARFRYVSDVRKSFRAGVRSQFHSNRACIIRYHLNILNSVKTIERQRATQSPPTSSTSSLLAPSDRSVTQEELRVLRFFSHSDDTRTALVCSQHTNEQQQSKTVGRAIAVTARSARHRRSRFFRRDWASVSAAAPSTKSRTKLRRWLRKIAAYISLSRVFSTTPD